MTPYTDEQMRAALQMPINTAEAISNLAQAYNEGYQRMTRGDTKIELRELHIINSQIMALAISNGEQIYLAAMLASIQQQQEKLNAAIKAEQDYMADNNKVFSLQ